MFFIAEQAIRKGAAAVCYTRIRRRRRSTPQPLAGEASKAAATQRLPCKGSWPRGTRGLRGGLAGRNLALCFVGADARHRPAAGVNARPTRCGKPQQTRQRECLPQGPFGGVKTPPYTPFIHRLFGDGEKWRGKGYTSFIHRLFGDETQRNVLAQRSARCRRCALRRRLAF